MTAKSLQQVYHALRASEAVTSLKNFSDQIGRNYTAVSSAMHGKRKLTDSLARRIRDTFPQVNPDFLRTGEGSPFISQQAEMSAGCPDSRLSFVLQILETETERNKALQRQVESLSRENRELVHHLQEVYRGTPQVHRRIAVPA